MKNKFQKKKEEPKPKKKKLNFLQFLQKTTSGIDLLLSDIVNSLTDKFLVKKEVDIKIEKTKKKRKKKFY